MKQRQNFSLYKRKVKSGTVFYFRTYSPDGRRTAGRSTGKETKAAARTYVENLLRKGSLLTKGDLTFGNFAANWFLWDKCLYVKERREGRGIGRTYVEGQRSYLENHILSTFKNCRLSNIGKEMILRWLHKLPEEASRMGRPLSKTTANHCLRILKLILKEAEEQGYIHRSPAQNISRLRRESRKRTLLTIEEVQTLFAEKTMPTIWGGNETHYTISLLAATTGMRLGELQALQFGDVRETYIDVIHSWERKFGIKSTKTNEPRFVITFSRTEKWLKSLIDESTNKDEHAFVFPSQENPRAPITHKSIVKQFYSSLEKIGVTEAIRKDRAITFHGWRHFFISTMRNRLPDWKLRILTGHKSSEMTDHYTTLIPKDFDDVRDILEGLFGLDVGKVSDGK